MSEHVCKLHGISARHVCALWSDGIRLIGADGPSCDGRFALEDRARWHRYRCPGGVRGGCPIGCDDTEGARGGSSANRARSTEEHAMSRADRALWPTSRTVALRLAERARWHQLRRYARWLSSRAGATKGPRWWFGWSGRCPDERARVLMRACGHHVCARRPRAAARGQHAWGAGLARTWARPAAGEDV